MNNKAKASGARERAAAFIVHRRAVIAALFVFLCAFAVYGLSLTKTNSDITSFLSEDTETARGLQVMNSQFPPLSSGEENGNYNRQLLEEMSAVLAISGAVILLVLLLTTSSFFEVAVCFCVFIVSALLNMGTHFLLGTVSSITNTVSVILQLALSIDYAIIFCDRCAGSEKAEPDAKAAVIRALADTFPEILSSSLTTVSGLLALTLMHFRFGADLGIALAKGVLVSMLTVFLLMPALMVFSSSLRGKTRHKLFVPCFRLLGKAASAKKPVFCIVFLILFLPAAVLSFTAEFAFSGSSVTPLISSGKKQAEKSTVIAVLVPKGSPDKEKQLCTLLSELPQVKSVTAYANMLEPYGLPSPYDSFTPAEAAELSGAGLNTVNAFWRLYALEKGDLAAQLRIGSLRVSLGDAAEFLFDHMDLPLLQENIPEELSGRLSGLRESWQEGKRQLLGETHARAAVTVSCVPGTEEAEQLLDSIHALLSSLYSGAESYVCGDVTSAHDLRDTFTLDSTRVNVLSALFVFVILTVTGLKQSGKKAPGPGNVLTALILVFVIQGSIFINFSFTRLLSQHPLFVTQMIGTAIQMGATVDYAIVLSGRYREERLRLAPREAAAAAAEQSFVTVMTSGSIMTVAGLTVAFRVSDVYVGHIGLIVGRGALISSLLVLLVLPQLLVLCDRKRNAFPAEKILKSN